jgi:hypothetical protein
MDLGKGKRILVRGGKFDPKYNITVPENFDARVCAMPQAGGAASTTVL